MPRAASTPVTLYGVVERPYDEKLKMCPPEIVEVQARETEHSYLVRTGYMYDFLGNRNRISKQHAGGVYLTPEAAVLAYQERLAYRVEHLLEEALLMQRQSVRAHMVLWEHNYNKS